MGRQILILVDRYIARSFYLQIATSGVRQIVRSVDLDIDLLVSSLDRQICREMDRQIPISVDLYIDRSPDRQIGGSVDLWIGRQPDRWIGRSMDQQISVSMDLQILDRSIARWVDLLIIGSVDRLIYGSVDRWISRSLDFQICTSSYRPIPAISIIVQLAWVPLDRIFVSKMLLHYIIMWKVIYCDKIRKNIFIHVKMVSNSLKDVPQLMINHTVLMYTNNFVC